MSAPSKRAVSVIVPMFNAEEYIAACLESVLAQTWEDFELIVVDDGSTDGSRALAQAYAERDERIRIVSQPNRRQGAARNRGLREASGEYVYFLDADDMMLPELLETCYRACENDSLDFATFDTTAFAEGKDAAELVEADTIGVHRASVSAEIMDGPEFWSRYCGDNLPLTCWLEFFRREFLVDNGIWFEEGIFFEDNDWILRVFLAARRVRYIPRALHRYRLHSESVTHGVFTQELAVSCLRLYGILRNLYDAQEDARCASMVEDAMHIMSHRFGQFRELAPTEVLARRTYALFRELNAVCEDAAAPLELRRSCLWTMSKISKGAGGWPDFPGMPSCELAISILLAGLPVFEPGSRIGIYGTGNACMLFLDAWERDGLELVFFETEPKPGRTFLNQPIHGIDQLASMRIDAIVIANVKYSREMEECLSKWNADAIPVFVIPREILLLEGAKRV